MPDIRIIPSKDIDRQKWDECVAQNENGLIYARSFYLDAMAENWSAVVVDDYRIIMPLTWRSKFGISYLSKEIFMQQLGVIGKANDTETIDVIASALKKFSLYGRMSFNFSNDVSFLQKATSHINFVLDLNKPYETVFKNYVESLQRNIRRAVKNNVQITGASNEEAAKAYQDYVSTFMNTNEVAKVFLKFKKMFHHAPENFFISRKAVDTSGNTFSICLWLRDNKRIYNLMPTTFPTGKDKVAMPLLLDNIIQEYCGQNMLFDFEGSELPGIRKFYEKFSPVNQPYSVYQYNRIPFLRKEM